MKSRTFIVVLFLCLLMSCGEGERVAGGGSELPNTVELSILSEDGTASSSIPVTLSKIRIEEGGDTILQREEGFTDSAGLFRSSSLAPGIWSLFAGDKGEGKKLLVSRILVVENYVVKLGKLTIRKGVTLEGKLDLPSIFDPKRVLAFVPGLEQPVELDSTGRYSLKNVPQNLLDIAFVYGQILNFGTVDLRLGLNLRRELDPLSFAFFGEKISGEDYYNASLEQIYHLQERETFAFPILSSASSSSALSSASGTSSSSSSTTESSSSMAESLIVLSNAVLPLEEISVYSNQVEYFKASGEEVQFALSDSAVKNLDGDILQPKTHTIAGVLVEKAGKKVLQTPEGDFPLTGISIEESAVPGDLLVLLLDDDGKYLEHAWASELGIPLP